MKNLKDELLYLKSNGRHSFFVIDPNFAFDRKRTKNFCEIVKKLEMDWFTELRLDHIDKEMIRWMAGSGCQVVRFGIESGSQRIIDSIRKGIDLRTLPSIIKWFIENDIVPVCGFMIGHPGEGREDFTQTLEMANKIRELGGEVTFSIQTPYPGTYLFKNADKLGLKIHSNDWSDYHHLNPVISTENFNPNELREMLFDAILLSSGRKLIDPIIMNENRPMIKKIAKGVKRRSFRSICLDRT